MAIKDIRAPDNRSGPRDRERWEREISKKLTNSDITLDELAQIFLTLQRDRNAETNARIDQIERRMVSNRTEELEYKVAELERKMAFLLSEDNQREIEENRRLAWLSHQKS